MIKKLGYYSCNGIEFESKIHAAIYAQKNKQSIKWHFNEEYFKKFPWHIEPELSLRELYNLRAKQIREEYDYVVLCYSGGSDSHNILESFIRQDLHIDEIISNWPLNITESILGNNINHNVSAEFKLNAADKLNYIKNKCPNTKIRMLDTSDKILDNYYLFNDESWVLNRKERVNPISSIQFNYGQFKEIREQFDKDKKIAMVVGVDKPKLRIIDNKMYIYFVDKVANMIPVTDYLKEYPNAFPIFFYWDPDSSLILSKQAHTVIRWLKDNPSYQYFWQTTNFKVIRILQEKLLISILYNDTWNNNWFQTQKSTKDWYSENDNWFFLHYKNTKRYQIWKSGIDFLIENIPDFLSRDKNGDFSGMLGNVSQYYFVGNL